MTNDKRPSRTWYRYRALVILALGVTAFLALWFVFFLGALLMDEDLNHWEWPSDKGPGLLLNLRMLAGSAALAALLAGLPTWLFIR